MICYAIKNEDGKYLGIARDVYDHYWTEIEWAHLFRDVNNFPARPQAEDFRKIYYPNCKVVKVEIREELESEHLLSETEWQDYCSYKRIEPQIKGCLDREKQLTERLNEYESLMKKHNIESIYKLDACLSDYLDVNSDTMAGKIIKQQKELLIAKNNEIKRFKAMKGREQLIAENEALKDIIAVVLAQKRNCLKNNEKLRNKLHTQPREIVENVKEKLSEADFDIVSRNDGYSYTNNFLEQILKEYEENSNG